MDKKRIQEMKQLFGMRKMRLCLVVLLSTLLWSCNDEDDIGAIFVGQTWYLGDFYETSDWKDDNNELSIYRGNAEAAEIMRGNGTDCFFITFQESTFRAKGLTNTFSGTWSADGKNNRLSFMITEGNAASGSGLEREITQKFYDCIRYAEYYRGNTIWLKFFPKDRKSFMQLTKNRREN